MRIINLVGQRFGRLVVKEITHQIPSGHDARWLCKCDCGNDFITRAGQLRSGNTQSCGCYQRQLTSKWSMKDIAGQKFGKLLVLEKLDYKPHGSKKVWWKCQCDCGNIHNVDGSLLRNGAIKSCGCTRHLEPGEASFNKLYYNYKTSWQRLDGDRKVNPARFTFEIPKEKFRELVKQNCFYCGKEPDNVLKCDYGDFVYNGLDRVDNTKGYTLDNVVPCCRECNFYKGTNTQEEFLSWVNRVIAYQEILKRRQ